MIISNVHNLLWRFCCWQYKYIHNACIYVHVFLNWTFLVAQMVKNPPAMQETWVWSLGWEDPSWGSNGNPFQCSCLENLMDRGAWWAIVHGVAELDTTDRLTLSLSEGRLKIDQGKERPPQMRLRTWRCKFTGVGETLKVWGGIFILLQMLA